MRETLPFDIRKLKEEDRKFLLSKNSQECLFNEQMILNNIILIISVFAILISVVTLITTSQYVSNNQKLFSIIFLSIITIYLIYSFIKSYRNIKNQQKVIEYGYNTLFKLHFGYTNKGKIK